MEEPELTSINMANNTQFSEIHDDPIEFVHEEPFIEDIVEDPHVTLTENIEDRGPSHDYFSDEDHICTLDQSQDETITKSYETYDEICNEHNDNSLRGLLPGDPFSKENDYDPEEDKYSQEHDTSHEESLTSELDDDYETLLENPIFEFLYDENPPCSPPHDEYLESWDPYDIFETHLFEEDCYNHKEDEDIQGLGTIDEHSLISDINGDDLFENPIYDMSSEGNVCSKICGSPIYDAFNKGSVYSETYESCKEEQSDFSYDQSEMYLSICNEDLDKQRSEESDGVQLVEDFFQPSSSHIDVPYDLEQFGPYTQSYQRIGPFDDYD